MAAGPRERTDTYSGTRFAAWYLAVQAVGIALWWTMLAVVPATRAWFLPDGAADADLLAFALPDLFIALPLSAVAAVAAFREGPWRLPLAWGAAASLAYAAAYTVAWSVLRGGGELGAVLMVPAAVLSGAAAVDVSHGSLRVFRTARPRSPRGNLATTFVQIVLFWGFFLFVLPLAIVHFEAGLGWPTFASSALRIVAVVLFAAASAVGAWSGYTMARHGAGTPLPMDSPNRLVVQGPYAYVRNPMVVAGLVQALAVALWLGSPLVVAYVLLGGALWQFGVRPAEEADLHRRFGKDYEAYRRMVPLWLPRRARPPPI